MTDSFAFLHIGHTILCILLALLARQSVVAQGTGDTECSCTSAGMSADADAGAGADADADADADAVAGAVADAVAGAVADARRVVGASSTVSLSTRGSCVSCALTAPVGDDDDDAMC